jgi:hypothetical protein
MSFTTSALLLSWVAILLLSLVVAGLIRQVHALAQGAPRTARLGPPPGSRAPEFDRLGPGLLLFLDRDCGTCTEVLTAATGPGKAIYAGPAPADAGTALTVLADEPGLFTAYHVPATPFAVLVDDSGVVLAAEPVGSAAALHALTEPAETR